MKSNDLYVGEKQTPRTVENRMSVYTYPYRWRTWRGFWGNIKAWFDNKSAARQRAKQGYCISDVWNADHSIIDYIINVLCEYRNHTIAWPDQYFTTFEEWIAYIDEIIDLFDYSRQNPDELIPYAKELDEILATKRENRTDEQNALVEKYYQSEQEIYKTQCEKRKLAFEKLSAHIDQIWY